MGKDLGEAYWQPGNGAAFLDLVQGLTGQPLSPDCWESKFKERVSRVVPQYESKSTRNLYKRAQSSSQVELLAESALIVLVMQSDAWMQHFFGRRCAWYTMSMNLLLMLQKLSPASTMHCVGVI